MLKETVNTIEEGRKVQCLEWELGQHKKLETQVADVLLFLQAVMGTPSNDVADDVRLDVNARNGLNFLLSQTASLLYYAESGTFFDLNGCYPYGTLISNPHTTAA